MDVFVDKGLAFPSMEYIQDTIVTQAADCKEKTRSFFGVGVTREGIRDCSRDLNSCGYNYGPWTIECLKSGMFEI